MTACVCGCAQDAATIAQLTETLRLRTEALARVTARAEKAEGVCDALRATVARVEALAGKWESPGLVCDCGHDLGQHNSNGCYARITYKPTVVVCACTETDGRYEDDFAIRDLRDALRGDPNV